MPEMPFESIDASELDNYLQEHPDAVLIDVRTDDEWNQAHISKATHIEMRTIPTRLAELKPYCNVPVICICAVGARSARVCEFLATQGHKHLINVEGGMMLYPGETKRGA